MSSYVHFTNEQKEQARQIDLCDLLQRQGEYLKKSGREWQWRDGPEKVTIRGNLWFHQYEQVGGDAIDFVRRFYNKSYPEAMDFLLGGQLKAAPNSHSEFVRNNSYVPAFKTERKLFQLPEANDNNRRVEAYLIKTRKLDCDVVDTFIRNGMIYESEDYHNVVFVGYDAGGAARHAHKRGSGSNSIYKGNDPGSDPRYSFHWHGKSETIYLFEAPIDMLSFISMQKENWENDSYAACCGVSDQVMWQMMKDNPNIEEVYLCLDNDEPGQAVAKRISEKLLLHGIPHEIWLPTYKDWNEDCQAVLSIAPHKGAEFSISESQEEEPCVQDMQLM